MTAKRNLGPILALTGAGIAVAAVVAGFIITGGPGDARDRRLDEITERRIRHVVEVIQCAFDATGAAPRDFESALATQPSKSGLNAGAASCSPPFVTIDFLVSQSEPLQPGQVSYRASEATTVQVCGNFRAARKSPTTPYADDGYGEFNLQLAYPQVFRARPAGAHCFELDLTKYERAPTVR
jgi:hypothetical protein